MVEWRRRLADFESKGWHNRVQVSIRPNVQYVGPGQPRGRQPGPRDGAHRGQHDLLRGDGGRAEGPARRGQLRAGRHHRVLDPGPPRRRLDVRVDRAGGRGRPPPGRRDRRHARGRHRAHPRRGGHRAGHGRRRARGLHHRRPGGVRLPGQRARGGAGPVAGRRALRARRAGGGGPPGGVGLGRGGGRRRRRAGRRGHPRRAPEAAVRRRPHRQDAPGAARPARAPHQHRRGGRQGHARAHEPGGGGGRHPLRRGPRHHRRGVGQQERRLHVHRALDAGAGRAARSPWRLVATA